MSYSSTGYSSCVTSVTRPQGQGYLHSITIFSKTGKTKFDYVQDFLNAFSTPQLNNIFKNTNVYTEYGTTNVNGDEIYYDIDPTTTFTHTLTALQNNTNEKTTTIIVVNPLISTVYDPYYKCIEKVIETPTTQQITVTGSPVTYVDLKHAFLQNTFTAFGSLMPSITTDYNNNISNFYNSDIRADIIIDENFVFDGEHTSGETEGYSLASDYINIKVKLERIKYGLTKYWDTGEYIKIPFGLHSYNGTHQYFPDSDILFFTEKNTQTFKFYVGNFPAPTTNEHRYLNGYLYTFFQYKVYKNLSGVFTYELRIPLYFNNDTIIAVTSSPIVTSVSPNSSDKTKINIRVKRGTSGGIYTIIHGGYYDAQFPIVPGTQPKNKDGEALLDKAGITL